MRRRIRIAFPNCQTASPATERVAAGFAALADVRVYPTAPDGTDVEAVIPAIAETAPDVVIALPKAAARLAGRVDAPVMRFGFSTRVVLARLEEALRRVEPVALLVLAGTIAPALANRIRLWRGSVFLFPYEDSRHLRALVVRCRRMGVKGLVGGESVMRLASQEGLVGVSLHSRSEVPSGVVSDVLVRAVTRAAPPLADGPEDLPVVRAVLRTIVRGGLRPGDTAIGVDRDGRVSTLFAAPARLDARAGEPPAVPRGTGLLEAVAALAEQGRVPGGRPNALAMDVYPLGRGATYGYLAVLHGSPRLPAGLSDTAAALRHAAGADDRFARLLEEISRLLDGSTN